MRIYMEVGPEAVSYNTFVWIAAKGYGLPTLMTSSKPPSRKGWFSGDCYGKGYVSGCSTPC